MFTTDLDDDEVQEGSSKLLEVSFADKDGNPAAPTSISYNVYCTTTSTEHRGNTAITPATSITITLTGDIDNTINNQDNRYEIRRVTLIGVDSLGNALNRDFFYRVINLGAIV